MKPHRCKTDNRGFVLCKRAECIKRIYGFPNGNVIVLNKNGAQMVHFQKMFSQRVIVMGET